MKTVDVRPARAVRSGSVENPRPMSETQFTKADWRPGKRRRTQPRQRCHGGRKEAPPGLLAAARRVGLHTLTAKRCTATALLNGPDLPQGRGDGSGRMYGPWRGARPEEEPALRGDRTWAADQGRTRPWRRPTGQANQVTLHVEAGALRIALAVVGEGALA